MAQIKPMMKNFDEEQMDENLSQFNLNRIDFVLVYEKNDSNKKHEKYRRFFLTNLKQFGLELDIKESDKNTFILIYTPFEVLLQIAEKANLKLPIEENKFEKVSTVRSCWNKLANLFSSPEAIEANNLTRNYFNAPYKHSLRNKFQTYFNYEDIESTFLEKDRILLTYQILSRTSYSQLQSSLYESSKLDMPFGIERLIRMNAFIDCFPLHQDLKRKEIFEFENKTDRQNLWEHWANPKKLINFQPIHLIRRYFGEKLGFYFGWLGFYTSSLILPTIVGLIVFIYGCVTVFNDIPTKEICSKKLDDIPMCPLCSDSSCKPWLLSESCIYAYLSYVIDNWSTVIFTIFMSVWSVVLVDVWQRKQTRLQFEWDTIDADKLHESIRPEFENSSIKKENKYTGEMEFYPRMKRTILSYMASFSVVVLMVALVLSFAFGTIVYRVVVKLAFVNLQIQYFASILTTITSATINLILICVLGYVYSIIAIKLTDLENHRTDSQYESALTLKMYLFQFANFYSSIFYIAFFKGRNFGSSKIGDIELNEQCDQSGCLGELCIQLAIIMCGKQILNNIQEIVLPWVKYFFKKRTQKQNTLLQWEKDFLLVSWNNLTLFDEYLEMVIQFGFITLFVMAFPLGPLFAFINNLIEIKVDAFKFLTQIKRPASTKARDIGIWLKIINTVSKFGVITNGFLIAFTSDFIPRMVYLISNNKENLTGYVSYTLSVKNLTDFNMNFGSNNTICRYKDFKYSYDHPNRYEYTESYWEVLAARLVFVVCFEHIVFGLVALMHFLIPNTPALIQKQIDHEIAIIQRAQWEGRQQAENIDDLQKLTIKSNARFRFSDFSSNRNDTDDSENYETNL